MGNAMRILIDTNIIISAALFPNGRVSALLKELIQRHDLCICSFSIDELHRVIEKKFKHKKSEADEFLKELSYELVYTPLFLNKNKAIFIRDPDDYPVLLSAINADVDVLLSGDNDFSGVACERPEVLSPSAFRDRYLR
jgi:putative PIN family toxin of toxin-antitoxin system